MAWIFNSLIKQTGYAPKETQTVGLKVRKHIDTQRHIHACTQNISVYFKAASRFTCYNKTFIYFILFILFEVENRRLTEICELSNPNFPKWRVDMIHNFWLKSSHFKYA